MATARTQSAASVPRRARRQARWRWPSIPGTVRNRTPAVRQEAQGLLTDGRTFSGSYREGLSCDANSDVVQPAFAAQWTGCADLALERRASRARVILGLARPSRAWGKALRVKVKLPGSPGGRGRLGFSPARRAEVVDEADLPCEARVDADDALVLGEATRRCRSEIFADGRTRRS